jgi:hypothetical protein
MWGRRELLLAVYPYQWIGARISKMKNIYDEHTAFDGYMNPEAGFHNGPGFQVP